MRSLSLLLATLVTLAAAACGGAPAASGPAPAPTATPYSGPVGATKMLDQGTTAFPRRVETSRGVVTIAAKPQRIHTLSVGFDEITFRLVDPSRIVAVGTVTVNPEFSNVADLASAVRNKVGRNAEQVIATNPDLVVAPPTANADLVKALESARVTVVLADLLSGTEAHEANIRLLAYLYGEEQRGDALIAEVRAALAKVDAVVTKKTAAERPRVLFLAGNVFAAGAGSNEDGIVRRAGGINVAAEAGITGNKAVSVEAIPGMRPDIIVVAESDPAKPVVDAAVVRNPALADVPAIRNKRTPSVTQRFYTTLSHWNVRGVEDLARIFYPADFR